MAQTDEKTKAQIAALLEERRGYEMHGKADRLKQVDEALKALGHKATPPAKRGTKAAPRQGTKL